MCYHTLPLPAAHARHGNRWNTHLSSFNTLLSCNIVSHESPGIAPGSLACGASVVLLDHDPIFIFSGSRGARTHKQHVCRRLLSKQVPHQFGWLPLSLITKAEAVRLELTSDCSSPPVFKTGPSTNSDGFRYSSCGGWDRTSVKTFRASHPTAR